MLVQCKNPAKHRQIAEFHGCVFREGPLQIIRQGLRLRRIPRKSQSQGGPVLYFPASCELKCYGRALPGSSSVPDECFPQGCSSFEQSRSFAMSLPGQLPSLHGKFPRLAHVTSIRQHKCFVM